MNAFVDTLVAMQGEEIDRMNATSPAPAPTLEDVIGALKDATPMQQHIAITLIHLFMTWPNPPAALDGDLTDRERYMLALFSSLQNERAAGLNFSPRPAAQPAQPDRTHLHPAIDVLQEADEVLTDFSVDAWGRDPNDAQRVASRWDAARDLVAQALNVARVAIKMDH